MPTPVVDQQGWVITILAGHPDDPNWKTLHHEAADTLENLQASPMEGHPQNLHHNDANTAILLTLINTLAFVHLTGFASSVFSTWVSKTFEYYTTYLCNLMLHHLILVVNWARSVFIAATFNFGPHTLCFRHCEHRYSFTQYSVGGLFYWVDYGYQTSEDYWGGLSKGETAEVKKQKQDQWTMGLQMFSKLEELRK
ncbi:hypothetical protein ARMSODRAFT_1022189 [Armillaria solidipes]|uniref:Uncharacterized protein n=1 Tax=Armillaria solidipes TaxID=1076256 RepID=A0A2H3BI94_9AGAR|nr:hypothetical protein ARMSODRAFT_1022189 [Armillaria solidipes]